MTEFVLNGNIIDIDFQGFILTNGEVYPLVNSHSDTSKGIVQNNPAWNWEYEHFCSTYSQYPIHSGRSYTDFLIHCKGALKIGEYKYKIVFLSRRFPLDSRLENVAKNLKEVGFRFLEIG